MINTFLVKHRSLVYSNKHFPKYDKFDNEACTINFPNLSYDLYLDLYTMLQ